MTEEQLDAPVLVDMSVQRCDTEQKMQTFKNVKELDTT